MKPHEIPKSGINWVENKIAPANSTENVKAKIYFTSLTTPCKEFKLRDSCITNLSLNVIFLPIINETKVAKDINPNPPICISIMITVFPK